MAFLGGFNAAEVTPTTSYDALPEGDYIAVITSSDEKPTKAGTGSYVEFVFEVVEGKFTGRKVWARLNLENPNPKAVAIARAELSAICRAVDILTPQDSEELHGIPMKISVKCEKGQDEKIRNIIKAYHAVGAQQPATAQAQAPTSGRVTPPWQQKASV